MPLEVVRPSSASATVVSNSSSMLSAGRTWTLTLAVVVAAVLEGVDLAGRDGDDVAGVGDDLLHAHAEGHRAFEDLEALLLLGVDVSTGHGAVGGELELDLQQLAVGVGSGLDERDLLAADGVLEGLSCVSHVGVSWEVSGGGSCDEEKLRPGNPRVVGLETVLPPLEDDPRVAFVLHVTNGDSTTATMERAGITGDLLPWRDVLHEGPVPDLPPEELRRGAGGV